MKVAEKYDIGCTPLLSVEIIPHAVDFAVTSCNFVVKFDLERVFLNQAHFIGSLFVNICALNLENSSTISFVSALDLVKNLPQ